MTVAEQVRYESGLRPRYAVIAFCAAVLLVGSQLIQLSGTHAPVSEATVQLINENQRAVLDIVGAVLDTLGLLAVAALLYWLHRLAQARHPEFKHAVRWIGSGGATLSAVMALAYTILFVHKAHQFVTTGSQSYPEASQLFSSTIWVLPGLLLELGNLLLAIGVILVALSTMRVGLFPRPVGYAGVLSGALFIIGVPVLTPVIQGFWLAATAVLLARRWPSGDPPAWESGEAVPWAPMQSSQRQQEARAARAARGQRRRRVSDQDVLTAVEQKEAPPNPKAGRSKRKRKR